MIIYNHYDVAGAVILLELSSRYINYKDYDKYNCGNCKNCLDKKRFGGTGKRKQGCIQQKIIFKNSKSHINSIQKFFKNLQ